MNPSVAQHPTKPLPSHSSLSFVNGVKIVFPVVLFLSLVVLGVSRVTVYAHQESTGDRTLLAGQGAGGIVGYVVGSAEVAAYACPDANTTKCPVKLWLKPGAQVTIVDNIVGNDVPGLNDNAWRKIVYQGQELYVPMHYISVSAPGEQPDISLVQTSLEDDSTSSPNFPRSSPSTTTSTTTSTNTSFSTAPGSAVIINNCNPNNPCNKPPCPQGYVESNNHCCPQGYTYDGSLCISSITTTVTNTVTIVKGGSTVTWYVATDGRIEGNAGDRIAVYCRRTGRIEVWSINDSVGRFLASFKHDAVDAAGKIGLSVQVKDQTVVTIGGDGHGRYWAALHDGSYNATGTGDFAKTFTCYVP